MIDLRRYMKYAFTALMVVLLLVSCKSSKTIVQGGSGMLLTGEEQLEAVIGNTPVFDSFSSRLRMTIPMKKGDYTLNGTLKMQRDELIQISLLLPIIRTEAARIEISPENILVIDRMNKRYASVPVAELREIFHTEVDFPMLQSFFTNAIFLPGGEAPRPSLHAAAGDNANELTFVHKSSEFIYSFLTSLESNRLVSSSIETHSSSYRLQWEYDNFIPVGQTTFPSKMTVLIGKKSDPSRTTFELSRIELSSNTSEPAGKSGSGTLPPARYEQIQLSDILKMLESL